MKLRKTRLIMVLLLATVLAVLGLYIYKDSQKPKSVDLGKKTFEMYEVYTIHEFDAMLEIESKAMYFSKLDLDIEELREQDSLDSLTIKDEGKLYLVNDTHVYTVVVKPQDTIKPEIVVTREDKELESITIPFNSNLSNYIEIEAFDTQKGNKIILPFDLSHSLDEKYTENFQLVINTTDGFNTVSKTLDVKVEAKVVDTPQKPAEDPQNNNLITSGLDRIDILVNKSNVLPASFVPKLTYFPSKYSVSEGYRAHPEAVSSYIEMVETMKSEIGEWMYVTSSYRDYEFQGRLYNNAIKSMGYEKASMLSAKPGASEHQTGLAIDVVTSGVSMYDFGTTKQSDWVSLNAHRFGFIIRYQSGYESITGYNAEPWHLRYLGKDLATKVYNLNIPYENVVGQ